MTGMTFIRTNAVNVADLVEAAALIGRIKAGEITGPSRFKEIMRPRLAVYHLSRRYGHSYPAIAYRLNRDHSSVISGAKRAEDLIARDADFATFTTEVDSLAYSIAEARKDRVKAMVARAA